MQPTPQKSGRPAPSVAAAPPAAQQPAPAPAADKQAPSKYQGVTRLAADSWAFTASMVDGHDTLVPGFSTEGAAAAGYDAVMRARGCRVLNMPRLPGELQAVVGESAEQTVQRCEAALAALQPAAAPKPSPPQRPPAATAPPRAPTAAPAGIAAPALLMAAPAIRSPDASRPPALTAAPGAPPAGSTAVPQLRSPDAKRLFKGVHCNNPASRSFCASVLVGDGMLKRIGPFPSEEAAARAYDNEIRLHKRRVVNYPTLPNEIQAVYGEREETTLREHERNPNRVAEPVRRSWKRKAKAEVPKLPAPPAPGTMLPPSPPLPLLPASSPPQPTPSPPPPVKKEERLYKGVHQGGAHRFEASLCINNKTTPLGTFSTAKAAADAYDARIRQLGGRVVNTPLLHGELEAVYGELDAATMHRADAEAARSGALPPQTSRRTARPLPPLPRAPPAVKRKAATSALERDSHEAPHDEDDDDSKDGGARPEPEPKRACLSGLLVPPAAQLPLALVTLAPPALPVVLAAPAGDAELAAFLRGITPPLADIESVAAAAAGSGLQLRHLRDAVVPAAGAQPHQGATNLHLVADILCIHRGVDKLALIMALQRAR